ncbi:adenylosuccinate synthase [Candidatus Nitronereus thalassa]|uniref:Adenylosuccinate synthetase n=1 Tax=Candidatus Nitronereus thalassa TaxID=3020898 RepID=A0ABU3K7G5_9BACT|nr:adenylosuccinate synthase [Candidatus Nitronereus thalassa]MDT7042318.1 adenylosuccinate synthase [Candidatus Nitronereus thalassa]
MANLVVIGSQWGDEGKGKIVDILSRDADLVVRYQGGSNAGHTVVTRKGTYIFHLIPSGILSRGKLCVLGSGVVIDPGALIGELDQLQKHGIKVGKNFMISQRAHVIMPYHKAIDKAAEKAKGARRIGTTGKGIGPAYVDKMARIGIRIGDLLKPEIFRRKVEDNLVEINSFLRHMYKVRGFSADRIVEEYQHYAERLRPHVADDSLVLHKAMENGRRVLFEGAQGTHLDIDFGTYPFVTSSSSCAGGACIGTGVGPTKIDAVLGVTKAYTTRVGSGPFPTELSDAIGDGLQERGQEFGATTGRARRCGWLDIVVLRYAVRVNGCTSLAVTKLDVLDGSRQLKIAVGYRYQGKLYRDMPADLDILSKCEPVYEVMPAWTGSTSGVTTFKALPLEAKRYLGRIEELTGCPIDIVSTGSHREHTIILKNPMTYVRPRTKIPKVSA